MNSTIQIVNNSKTKSSRNQITFVADSLDVSFAR